MAMDGSGVTPAARREHPPLDSAPPPADSAPPPAPAAAATPPPNPMEPPLRRRVFAVPRPVTVAGNPAESVPAAGKHLAKGQKPAASAGVKRQQAAATGEKAKKLKKAPARRPRPKATPEAATVEEVPPTPPPPPPAEEEEQSSIAPPAASHVLDELSQSVDDEAFLQQMNVESQEYETPSQEYETNYDEENLDGYYEGFLDEPPRGRTANYTVEEDKLIVLAWKKVGLDPAVGTEQPKDTYWRRMKELFDAKNKTGNVRTMTSIRHRWGTISTDCQKWRACLAQVDIMNPSGTNGGDRKNIAQNLFKGAGKKGKKGKKGKPVKLGKSFTLHHCWVELENDEKWKNRELYEVPKRNSSVGDASIVDGDEEDDGDEASSDEGKRSTTPNSVAKTKNPLGRKAAKEKGKKTGDDDIKESLEAMMNARKEMNEERKAMKLKELEEQRHVEQRKVAIEERRMMAEERRAVAEELKASTEERKVAMEEQVRAMEQEQKLMFMDTSGMDEKQKAYVELCRDQVLAKKQMMATFGGGFMNAMGGMGGGSMGAMNNAMGGFGGGFMGAMGGGMVGGLGGAMGGGGMAGGGRDCNSHVTNNTNVVTSGNVDQQEDANVGNDALL